MTKSFLFVGDIVGPAAAQWLAGRLPDLRDRHAVDWVVVNAENCAVTGPSPMDGFGMTLDLVEMLVEAGVDVITGGNHSWDGPDVDQVLAHPQVVRPFNVGEGPGRGALTVERGDDHLTVVNLLSPTAALPGMRAPEPSPLWPAWQLLRDSGTLRGAVLVDLHGESAWEKASFATAVDGQVTAVLGTHTHDPTLRGHILPAGTAYVTEVGMTGHLGHTGGGFDPAHFAAALRGEDHAALGPYRLSDGPLALGAVAVVVGDDEGGRPRRALSVSRVA